VKVKAQPSGGIQPQPLGWTIQRQDQQVAQIEPPKPLGWTIQRQDQQVAQIGPTKPLGWTIQRQDQQVAQIGPPKPLGWTIQRQDQQVAQIGPPKPLGWIIQRQDAMIASKLPHLGKQATVETASTNTERPSSSPQAQTEAKEKALEAKEEAAKSDELEEPQSVKIVPQREPSAAAAESVADTKAGDESNPVAEAMEATTSPDAIELPKEAAPQIEGDKTRGQKGVQTTDAGKGAALEGVPETQALEQSVAKDESANLNPEGSGEAASPETVAQKEEATANAAAANAKLEATNGEAAQLASNGISFALPQQEETANANDGLVISRKADNSGGDLTFLEQQRAAASSMASGFLANAAGRVQTITSLGQTITPSIQSAAESAKAAIIWMLTSRHMVTKPQLRYNRAGKEFSRLFS
jgi:hypothetical protein